MKLSLHSLRLRLAVTTAAWITLSVLLIGTGTYVVLRSVLENEVRTFAVHEAEEVGNVIEGLETPEAIQRHHDRLEPFWSETGVVGFEVWTLGGELVARFPPGGSADSNPWPEGIAAALAGRPAYHDQGPEGRPASVRAAHLVRDGDEPRWIVTAAVESGRVGETLRRFVLVMGAALPLVAAASFLGTLFVVSRAFEPVQDLVRDARVVAERGPSYRLSDPPPGSELAELAGLVNEMLDRTEGVVERLRQFSANVGHEVLTPLTRIRGEAEAALTEGDPRRMREALASALEELEGLSTLVGALLELAHGEEPVAPRAGRVRLTELAGELAEEAALLGREREIAVSIDAPFDDVEIEGERVLVARALWNVLANALKYTPAGGRVSLRLRRGGSDARLEVRDTGPGLGPHPEGLFEAFVKGEPNAVGHGLGLTLARTIARRHRGDLTGASDPGGGACFVFTFPVAGGERRAAGLPASAPEVDSAPGAPLRPRSGVR